MTNPFDTITKKKNPFDSTTIPKKEPGVLARAIQTTKDVFAGGDQTTGGIIRNTITGLPAGFAQTIAHPVKSAIDLANATPIVSEMMKTGGAIKQSIEQGSIDPVKKLMAERYKATFPQEEDTPEERLAKTQNLVLGFVGGTGDISELAARNAAKEFAAQEAKRAAGEVATKEAAAKTLALKPVATAKPSEPPAIPQIEGPSKAIIEPQKIVERPIQQQILEARKQQALLEAEQATTELPTEFPTQAKEVRDVVKGTSMPQRIPSYTDIGNTKKQLRDLTRNTMEVFGPEDFKIIDQSILEPFNQAKGANIDTLNRELDALKQNIIDRFGFQQSTPESAAIQLYGEKKIGLAELETQFGKDKATQITEAEKFFRDAYDRQLDALNAVEKIIYPNSAYKWTPKRADYFRHYHELTSDFTRLQNILEKPIRIDPMLSGISETTAPKSRWASFKQMREGEKTKIDAIGGYLDYLPSWSYAVNIDPHIGKFRELADVLARGTQKSKNLNNYIYNLRMFANELSGKSAEWDRIVNESVPGGRTTLQAVNWLNNRVKANTILFNVSSSIAQIYNIPQGLASAGLRNSAKGLAKTLGQIFTKNKAMAKSNFLKERYFKGFQVFDKGVLNNIKKFGTWMVTVLDEAGTRFIWNGQYEKALQEGVANPVKYADDATKLLVAGRGIGEKPLLQNSKVMQIVAPFQLELTNLWWVMEDLAKSDKTLMKKFGQFATLFASLYLLNNGTEKLTGNRLALDPIQMTLDGIQILKNEQIPTGALKAGGRIAGEVLSNIPFGQTFAAMYPEYGTTVAGVKLPTRKQLFGREDPTRYGGGLMTTKALSDPLFKILPPFGGGQLKKTVQGVSAVLKGKSTNVSGDWQYHINPSTSNLLKASLFGKSGTPEAQAYYAKQVAPKKKSSGGNPFDN